MYEILRVCLKKRTKNKEQRTETDCRGRGVKKFEERKKKKKLLIFLTPSRVTYRDRAKEEEEGEEKSRSSNISRGE